MRLVIVVLVVILGACTPGRIVYHNFVSVDDYEIFNYRSLQPSSQPYHFPRLSDAASSQLKLYLSKGENKSEVPFEKFLEKTGTVAFLIIRRDTVIYEKYLNEFNERTPVASFSVTKSFLSALIGFAIQDGYISSVNDPVRRYVPELTPDFDSVTVRHLLQMNSGIRSNDQILNPFSQVAKFYYGKNLRKAVSELKMENSPGSVFNYSSASSQLLGYVLEKSLKNKTLTSYLQEKIWEPLGMENGATWSLDRENGMEKSFCCLNASARDFAKFGRLYLRQGNWNGKQLLSKEWIRESTTADTTGGNNRRYKYQWWLGVHRADYFAQGVLGQFIYVYPEKDIIIVRLGKRYGYPHWRGLFGKLADRL